MTPRHDAPSKVLRRSLAALVLLLVPAAVILAARAPRPRPQPKPQVEAEAWDWPMSRHDVARSGATPHQLPSDLYPHWVRQLPPLSPAWPDQPKMPFDAAYDPVVVGNLLYVASSLNDTITAYDVETGEESWSFLGDGPFRFAPLWWEGKLYAACDDGCLYCLDAEKGKLLWKFRSGPSDRKVLGNGRLISAWPARGAPVIADGVVYFTASIWPFMGLFIHALDARTGEVVWTNSGDGSVYIKQPHNTDSFAGVAPQGHLALSGDRLLLPGGRSVPACYDRQTGKLVHYRLADNSKKGGGHEVAVTGNLIVNGGAAFALSNGDYLGEVGDLTVADREVMYSYSSGKLRVLDLRPSNGPAGPLLRAGAWSPPVLASAPVPDALALLRAGSRLYVGRPGQVAALRLPLVEGRPGIVWQASVEGRPQRLIAARDRLFVVTLEGRLYCFGPGQPEPAVHRLPPPPPPPPPDEWTVKAREILQTTGVRDGYCIAWGVGSGRLVRELLAQSRLEVIALDPDPERVADFRARLIEEGLYGRRVSVLYADPRSLPLPPYLASLMVSEGLADIGLSLDDDFLPRLFQSLRPYGGVAWLPLGGGEADDLREAARRLNLARAAVACAPAGPPASEDAPATSLPEGVLLMRPGALPGSADWTHEHADAANTRVSRDQVVKAPLGLLWFGGTSNDGILPRHGHGPQPQVIDGRILIEGVDFLRAVDCYTGRLLWETKLPGLGKPFDNTNHQPGANAAGSNFVSAHDGVYVAHGQVCTRLDPATGRKLGSFPLPGAVAGEEWDYVNVVGDLLVGGSDPPPPKVVSPPKALANVLSVLNGDEVSSSRRLVVLDRHTGKLKWGVTARYGFRHNAICVGNGRLFAIDRLAGTQLAKLKPDPAREADVNPPARLVAFDLATGKELWSTTRDVFGTWLSYSESYDVLLEAGRVARDVLTDEPKGMRAYRGGDGKVLWFDKTYEGPAMVHGDTVLQGQGACDVLTGKPRLRTDPLTGEQAPWVWSRNYGCNTPAASENLLTFRSGAAGFLDLCRDGGTGNLGGFRSSCTNNLIVADGVLSAPDYTRTCTCSYQNQTSLALVPTPDAEMWTFFTAKQTKGAVRRLGLNLGAPGDRRADDGTLWLEYPSVGGDSPPVKVTTAPARPEWFRKHSSLVQGDVPWVASSGAKGLTSLTLTLDEAAKAERSYTVRLHFLEPDGLGPGERVFAVGLQGREVIAELDVAREAGGADRGIVREFTDVKAGKTLTVTLTPARGAPVLSGIEVVSTGP